MERNVGGWDRILRIVLGIVLMAVGFGVIGGSAGIAIGVIFAVVFVTGVFGRCLLYVPLRLNTYIRI
jgi:hypothetical protein